MLKKLYYEQPIFLNSLAVSRYEFHQQHHHQADFGHAFESMGYLHSGCVEISSGENRFVAERGDLIFIPKNVVYQSKWRGSPQIAFTTIQYTFLQPLTHTTARSASERIYNIQKLPELSVDLTQLIDTLYLAYAREDGSPYQALSLFYQLYHGLTEKLSYEVMPIQGHAVRKATLYLENNPTINIDIPYLAQLCNMSESRFYVVFKAITGLTPVAYKHRVRVQYAVDLLLNSQASVDWISEYLNFSSPSYFRRIFRKYVGLTPSQLRNQSRGL